ncbi:MAG: GAF domain-containing protein [Moorellales bacterium]
MEGTVQREEARDGGWGPSSAAEACPTFRAEEDPLWWGYEGLLADLVANSFCSGALLFLGSRSSGGSVTLMRKNEGGEVDRRRLFLGADIFPYPLPSGGEREQELDLRAINALLAAVGEPPAARAVGTGFFLPEQRVFGFALLGGAADLVPAGAHRLLTGLGRHYGHLLSTVDSLNKERKLLNDTLACLREANERLLEGGGFEAALERVLEAARNMVGAEGAGLLLYEEETGYLALQKPAFGSYDEHRISRYKVTTEDVSNAVRVFKTREPYFSNDAPQDPRFVKHLLDLFPARSVVSLPVVVGNRCIGVMHVTNKPGGFTEEDVTLLKSVVSQLAVAIANARLVCRIKLEETQSRVLYELSRDFNLLDPEGLVKKAAQAIPQVMPVLGVAVAVCPEGSDRPRIVAAEGVAGAWIGRFLPAGSAELEVKDLRADPIPGDWVETEARTLGAATQVRAVIATGGEYLGSLLAWVGPTVQLTSSQLRFLSLVASQLAMAVRNARLFASERRMTRRLERITGTNEQLARLILDGAGLKAITEALAKSLQRKVAFYDCRLVRRAWAGFAAEELAAAEKGLRGAVAESARSVPAGREPPCVVPVPPAGEMVLLPIELAADIGGYLGVLVDSKEEYEEIKEIVLRVLPIYALELLKEQSRVAQGVIQFAEQELVSGLVGGGPSAGEVLARAAGLGYDVARPHLVVVCLPTRALPEENTADAGQSRKLSRAEVAEIRAFIRQAFSDNLCALVEGRLVVLIPGRLERARRQLETMARNYRLWVGVGGYAEDLSAFSAAFSQACFAVEYARRLKLPPGITSFQELGLYQALAHEETARCLYQAAVALLGPLIERDGRRDTGYLKTLASYYAANGSIKGAAEALFCHPNTIRYRLERIRDLLGAEIDQADRRLNLEVALRVIHFYHPEFF